MAKFVVYKDIRGEYRWRFKSANGRIITDSGEGYDSKAGAQSSVEFVKKYAPGASVVDLTISSSLLTLRKLLQE